MDKIPNKTNKLKLTISKDDSRILTFLDKFLLLLDTYGVKKILQACAFFVTLFLVNVLFSVLQNDTIVEKIVESMAKNHSINSEIRSEINPKVNTKLLKMVYDLRADRAFILEMHNGKENPTSLPFLYCDMTYEEVNEQHDVRYINDEYENLNMSKYDLPNYLYKNRVFIGTIEELRQIDRKLAARMDENGVKYCALILIKSSIEIGFLGVSYNFDPCLTKEQIHAKMGDHVQEISILLDLSKHRKK